MEIDENRGLINKKAYEDQFIAFFSTNVFRVLGGRTLSIISLSYSCTLRAFLDHSSIRERKAYEGKGGKGKKISSKEELYQEATTRLLPGIKLHG